MLRGTFMVLLAFVIPILNLALNDCQADVNIYQAGEVAFLIGTLVDIELSFSSCQSGILFFKIFLFIFIFFVKLIFLFFLVYHWLINMCWSITLILLHAALEMSMQEGEDDHQSAAESLVSKVLEDQAVVSSILASVCVLEPALMNF